MEEVIQVPKAKLNSGHQMPLLAMGTCSSSPQNPDQLTSILIRAIEIGYRHFDTAVVYGSEEALGRAVAAAVERGLVASRDELFITTKLWCTETEHHLVVPALKRSLGRLGLDYVDLYLIHLPFRAKDSVEDLHFKTENIVPFDMKGTWEGMENCCKLGLAKSIGVSNFTSKKISQLLQNATIPPAVNLVALRWVYQQGACVVIVTSFNNERIKENLQIFNWELEEDEIAKIQQIHQRRGFKGAEFVHSNGPYKSVEELWDGDI
nr:methylecgonone reductase-like [Ipomoea batatas]